MTDEEQRVANLIRVAFSNVRLGNGIGLLEGQGLDDYASKEIHAKYRAMDEKEDWSKIPSEALNRCYSSLSFFDTEGMRFHLPAFMIATLEGTFSMDVSFHLTHFEITGDSQFSLLSKAQRQAVREFLLSLKISMDEYPPRRFAIESALKDYWI
jgi:hypothetical protein